MVREEMKDVPYVAENTATFTVALITYSTLILAWATELGGASFLGLAYTMAGDDRLQDERLRVSSSSCQLHT